MDAIHLKQVSKRFGGNEAIAALDLRIAQGSLTGLVGPDGAGKTTLMRMLAGLMEPTAGDITVAGIDVVKSPAEVHARVGYMPQRFGLYEDLTVAENLELYASLRNLGRADTANTFERLLHFTRLEPFTRRQAGRLSGGMKQKLGLACALMAGPRVLLLDEPSVGVDPISRRELWAMVRELAGEGMAVVWSTAYLDEAERCERVLLLDAGRLLHDGPPGDLTGRLEGRCFTIAGLADRRRSFLMSLLSVDGIRDGVIQGDQVRLVTDTGGLTQPMTDLINSAGATVETAEPRFEDAYIDMLGGAPGGRSALADRVGEVSADHEIMVSCRNLTKRFGNFTATDAVSFDVRRGEIFGLLGPNGAGKSTTFRMLCGLLAPTEGEAEVVGLDLRRSASAAKLKLGYMAQKFSLYGLLSVRQNLEFFSGAYGLAGRRQRERIREMIDTFGLEHYLAESPDTLPLGYKQRLALACALMHRPTVLFLDEPTSGVDPLTRREFWKHITHLVGIGVTVLVTTHFMDEAEYCDRVALVSRAKLIALDTPDALKASVADEQLDNPTMEDAFVRLVERHEQAGDEARAA